MFLDKQSVRGGFDLISRDIRNSDWEEHIFEKQRVRGGVDHITETYTHTGGEAQVFGDAHNN